MTSNESTPPRTSTQAYPKDVKHLHPASILSAEGAAIVTANAKADKARREYDRRNARAALLKGHNWKDNPRIAKLVEGRLGLEMRSAADDQHLGWFPSPEYAADIAAELGVTLQDPQQEQDQDDDEAPALCWCGPTRADCFCGAY